MRCRLVVSWVVRATSWLVWVCASAALAAQQPAETRGRLLREVLDEMRATGAPLVYSSNLLPDSLRVVEEPGSREPLARARELLAPHGLAIREADGVWLVVRSETLVLPPSTGRVAIDIAPSADGPAVAGAIAQLDAPSGPVIGLVGGAGAFGDVSPGRHDVVVRAPGYLQERAAVVVQSGRTASLTVMLVEAAPALDELTVSASRYDLVGGNQPSTTYFSRDDIERSAVLGGDALRVAQRLPGIAAAEFSSRAHVRGGALDEMTVILDGMELVEPFHLRDYQATFSAVDPRIVSGMHVYSGGFPAQFGDALSGLTIIEHVAPARLTHELGVSFLQTSLLSSGTFARGRGDWIASLRRGNIDRVLNDEIGEPSYRDAFVHVGGQVGDRHRLEANGIGLDDDIALTPSDRPGKLERASSDTAGAQAWVALASDWSVELSSRTLVHSTRLSAGRRGVVDDAAMIGRVDDWRKLRVSGVKQDWTWAASDRQSLTWGVKADRLEADYRYSSTAEARGVFVALGAPAAREIALAPDGESYAAYLSDRLRITDRLIVDIGVRWDRQTFLPADGDDQFSPRSGVLYRLGADTDLRVSFGRFFQSERLADLQVEDGVAEFAPAQNAAHSIVGVEHRFGGGLALRVEAFEKWTKTVRPRYENLFDPFVVLPELRPGRMRVAPERALARGLEVLVNGAERPLEWWLGYSYARAVDILDGRSVPRSWDQRHALDGGIALRARAWTLSAAATYHTGWPATAVDLATVTDPAGNDVEVAVAGERNAERLDMLRRIDFRAERGFDVGVGTLRFFAEVTNVTGRRNPCCWAFDATQRDGSGSALERIERGGLPFLVNAGVRWEF